MDVTQGKLGMGFACGSDDYAAALMGNTLFGGSSNSKLFLNVREKLSLCYYASSAYHRQKRLITVSSGIEFQNYQKAYDEIMAQLAAGAGWPPGGLGAGGRPQYAAERLRLHGRFPRASWRTSILGQAATGPGGHAGAAGGAGAARDGGTHL